jgi:two-component system, cell cycle sensor histidine kinase and response regulator CckA
MEFLNPDTGGKDASANEGQKALYAEQVKQLYDNASAGLLATTINSLILVGIQRNVTSRMALIGWFVSLAAINLLRYIDIRRFQRVSRGSLEANRWGNRFIVGLALSGMAWGSAGILLFPVESLGHQTFLVFVIGGMVAGGAAAFSSVMKAFLAYSIPALGPIVIRFGLLGDEIHVAMGGMALLFGLIMTFIARHMNSIAVTSLKLRFDNSGLVSHLTERKKAEETLRKSEMKYRKLHESMMDGFVSVSMDGMIKEFNESYQKILGYTADELSNLTYRDLTPEQWHTFEQKIVVEQVLARGYSEVYEKEYRKKDGTIFPVELRTFLIKDETGNHAGMWAIIRDITERKRAEESLKQSEENARQLAQENATMAEIGRIVSSTLDTDEVYESLAREVGKLVPFDRIVINIIDAKKNIVKNVYISGEKVRDRNTEEFYPLNGSGNAEMVRTRSTLLIQTENFDEYQDRFPMLLSTFQAGFRSILNVPLSSKGEVVGGLLLRSRKPYAYTDRDVKLAERIGSQIAGAIANAQLHTERIHAEKERAAIEEQLRQSQKMEAIGQLAGGIAHDFNNLLTVINGYVQLSLMNLENDAPLRRNIDQIQGAADRASNLTRQLLAFSRRQILEFKVLDLNAILHNLNKMLHRVIGEDIELVNVLSKDLGKIKGDSGQIEQVIINLAVNARDAMPKGGRLVLETANVDLDEECARTHMSVNPGSYVKLSVIDTGTGMTPEVKERVFEPFFTTKEKGKGTGLGLSTVYGIVKQSGGEICVDSQLGQGTVIDIYFPRMEGPGKRLEEKVEGVEMPRGKETILLAEDEEMVRELASKFLKSLGYIILEAKHGDEALQISGQHKGSIDLLLTDVVMPGMSGRELVGHLASLGATMKVLYMSGYTDDAIVHHGVLEKGVEFIQKPFALAGLARKVREVLDKDSKPAAQDAIERE